MTSYVNSLPKEQLHWNNLNIQWKMEFSVKVTSELKLLSAFLLPILRGTFQFYLNKVAQMIPVNLETRGLNQTYSDMLHISGVTECYIAWHKVATLVFKTKIGHVKSNN